MSERIFGASARISAGASEGASAGVGASKPGQLPELSTRTAPALSLAPALALICALALSACAVGEQPPTAGPEATRPIRKEPMVRIGIKIDTAQVMLSSMTAAQIVDRDNKTIANAAANDVWTFTSDASGAITGQSANGLSASSSATPLTFRAGDDAFVKIGDKVYRGTVVLRPAGAGRVTAINVLEMERYIMGVVSFEIGRLKSPDIEALKAQAIAARTYAIGNMNSRGALGFDFYATVADQVYGGTSGEDSVVTRAVLETRGEIVTHAGQPIIAYYSSTCGGHTADVNESWPWRPPQPYLKGKPDLNASGEAFCKTSNRFRWAVAWPGDSLRIILQQTLRQRLSNPALVLTKLEDIRVTGTSKSGRAEAVAITADGNTYRVPADSIRWVLRPTPNGSLNSSLLFDLKATIQNGEVARLDVNGGGWGHGVGMCQVGAINRARAGQSYRDIMAAYYTDTKVERLY